MGIPAHGVFSLKRNARLFVAALVFTALGVAAWFSFDRLRSSEKIAQLPTDEASQVLPSEKLAQDISRDSDKDGLKDWEEELYRTDPKNPDSDGDKTPDGQEILQNRDPLKKGPNDKLDRLLNTAGTSGAANAENDNLTYNLTRNILASGVLDAIDSQGNLTSSDFLQNIQPPTGIDPETILDAAAAVTAKDLSIIEDNSPEAIRKYFESVFSAFQKNPALSQQSDLLITVQTLQSNDFERLAELDPIISTLSRTANAVQRIPVPRSYAAFAVQEIRYLRKTKRAVEIFRNTQNDPLATALILRPRINLLAEIAKFHADIREELKTKGIVAAAN